MAISPIGPRLPMLPKLELIPPGTEKATQAGVANPPVGPSAAANSFSQLLKDAVGQIDGLQKTADSNRIKLATGQPVDLHEVTFSAEQASLAFQLGLQVRNKLIDAYQEIARLQI